MEFLHWHWWAAAGLILMTLEIFAPGFVLVCLGIGCFGGSIAAAIGLSVNMQLLAFSLVTIASFLLVRPVLMKKFWKEGDVKTNVDALVGMRGKVTTDFDPKLQLGRVAVGGDDWRAETDAPTNLIIGDIVRVIRVESNTVVVEPMNS